MYIYIYIHHIHSVYTHRLAVRLNHPVVQSVDNVFFKPYIAVVTTALSWPAEERGGEGIMRQLPPDLGPDDRVPCSHSVAEEASGRQSSLPGCLLLPSNETVIRPTIPEWKGIKPIILMHL